MLTRRTPSPGSYVFEVVLRRGGAGAQAPGGLERFIGEQVEVKHYQPIDGAKSHVGLLRGYDIGDVTVEVNGAERVFKKAQVAQVRLHMTI